jgi:hypothetical protein
MTAIEVTVVLDRDEMVGRLISLLESADDSAWQEGTYWYASAHSAAVSMAEQYSVTVECAAGVIAALSPRLAWRLNLEYAHRIFRTGDAPVLLSNKRKALRIAAGEHPGDVLSGAKVRSFYACIVSPLADTVCIDRHAIDAALGFKGDDTTRKVLDRKGAYEHIVDVYTSVADYFGIAPAQCQAIAWVAWRG